MTMLGNQFISRARHTPIDVQIDGRQLTLRESRARADMLKASLEIVENGKVLGFVTRESGTKSGIVSAPLFGVIIPQLFSDLETGLRRGLGF